MNANLLKTWIFFLLTYSVTYKKKEDFKGIKYGQKVGVLLATQVKMFIVSKI